MMSVMSDRNHYPVPGIWINPTRHSGAPCLADRRLAVSVVLDILDSEGRDILRREYDLTNAEIDAAVDYLHYLLKRERAISKRALTQVVNADFNRLDRTGRLRLSGMVMHEGTNFSELAAAPNVIFRDGDEAVSGRVVWDQEQQSWMGEADWRTQRSELP